MSVENTLSSLSRRVHVEPLRALLVASLLLAGIGAASDADAKGKLPVKWEEGGASATDLDLENHRLLFEENFDEKALSGPKVFAPVHAPFGAGAFDKPGGPAYEVTDGNLVIKAYKQKNKWRSGSVQTANADQSAGKAPFTAGKGFACADCYFEARMKFPQGKVPGLWAAFWLLSPESSTGHTEIDVIEWYGGDPKGHHQAVHIWPKDRKAHAFQSNYTGIAALNDGGWHTYGAQLRDGTVHVYMDRKEISRVSVPAAFATSYYAVVTLAVLQKEADRAEPPFNIAVDYIRAYQPATAETE